MPSLCGGNECLFCKGSSGCLAGNGDDDFEALELEEVHQILNSGYHTRLKRKLSDQESKTLDKVVKNGYNRISYKTVCEKVY